MTPEEYISAAPPQLRKISAKLLQIIRLTFPRIVEKYYAGWGLIGYRIPDGNKTHYLGYISINDERVSLGFELGHLIDDPYGILTPTGRQVSEIRFFPGDVLNEKQIIHLLLLAEQTLLIARKK